MAEKKRANRKKRILFLGRTASAFIGQDVQILRKNFDVRVIDFIFSRKNPKGTLTTLLKMVKGILWADATFSWFADFHAALAVLFSEMFRKRSIIVAGGCDVASEPSINYGIMRFPKSKPAKIAKFALKHADRVLAVSEFNKKEALNYVDPKKVELVYNAVDCDKFKPAGKKEDIVLMVGPISRGQIKIHGLHTFVNCAKALPATKFIVVGLLEDTIEYFRMSTTTSNVEFVGFLPQKNLIPYYQKAKVYCQLSYRESFGVALAEAMLCECVPVVTERGAMPEIVGDSGFYVPYEDTKATSRAIKEALKSDKGKKARERVESSFNIERREEALVCVIEETLKKITQGQQKNQGR